MSVCVCGKRREWHIVKADNDQFFFCSWMTLKKCYIVLSKVLQYISIYLRWHGISCINNFHWYQVHLHNKSENILFYSDFTGFCVHSQPALHTHHSNHFHFHHFPIFFYCFPTNVGQWTPTLLDNAINAWMTWFIWNHNECKALWLHSRHVLDTDLCLHWNWLPLLTIAITWILQWISVPSGVQL